MDDDMNTPRGREGLSAYRVRLSHGDRIVLDGVDISAAKGEVTALVGPNGAGKSTLLRLIAGAGRASSGEIVFDGESMGVLRRRGWAQRTALIEQEWTVGDGLTARQLVELGRLPHQGWFRADAGEELVVQSLERAGAAAFAGQLVQTLSGGERQRVNVARALAQQPSLLLCDEPTNHLDIRAQLSVLRLLRDLAQGGISVMIALHDLNHAAAFADHVVVLVDGSVRATGSVAEVLTEELIAEVWGVRAEVVKRADRARPSILYETEASRLLT